MLANRAGSTATYQRSALHAPLATDVNRIDLHRTAAREPGVQDVLGRDTQEQRILQVDHHQVREAPGAIRPTGWPIARPPVSAASRHSGKPRPSVPLSTLRL